MKPFLGFIPFLSPLRVRKPVFSLSPPSFGDELLELSFFFSFLAGQWKATLFFFISLR